MAEYVRDDFARTVASGWGTAVVGGAYTESLTGATSNITAGRGWGTIAHPALNAGVAYQKLAAATAASDVAIAAQFRLAIVAASDHTMMVLARASGTVADPAGIGARVILSGANGAMRLELVKVAAGNVV